MRLVLNDIKYLSLDNISFYKDRIYYDIKNIKLNGIYIKFNKKMILNDNKYIVYLNKDILKLNDLLGNLYKPFIRDINNPSIEVIKNDKTDDIFNDNSEYLLLNFMSINDNYYPKIHILPCQIPNQ